MFLFFFFFFLHEVEKADIYLEDMVNTKCIAIFDAINFPLKLILFANTISCDFEHNQIT
jgi:hypothetical protein